MISEDYIGYLEGRNPVMDEMCDLLGLSKYPEDWSAGLGGEIHIAFLPDTLPEIAVYSLRDGYVCSFICANNNATETMLNLLQIDGWAKANRVDVTIGFDSPPKVRVTKTLSMNNPLGFLDVAGKLNVKRSARSSLGRIV